MNKWCTKKKCHQNESFCVFSIEIAADIILLIPRFFASEILSYKLLLLDVPILVGHDFRKHRCALMASVSHFLWRRLRLHAVVSFYGSIRHFPCSFSIPFRRSLQENIYFLSTNCKYSRHNTIVDHRFGTLYWCARRSYRIAFRLIFHSIFLPYACIVLQKFKTS